jgi:hypothetical protein
MPYEKSLSFEDFGFATDKALTISVWNRIGTSYVIPAQCALMLGKVRDGFIAALLKDTSNAAIYGRVRIVAANSEETKRVVLVDFNSRATTSLSDKTLMLDLPIRKPLVRQDSKLILEIMPEAAVTMDYGNTTSRIDVTMFT